MWRVNLGYPVLDLATVERPDGQRVAAVTDGGSIYVIDPADGSIVGRFEAGDAALRVVAADLDGDGGQEIAVSSADGNIAALR